MARTPAVPDDNEGRTPAAVVSQDQARRITAKINAELQKLHANLERLHALLSEAHSKEAWAALGYASWDDYIAGELELTEEHYKLLGSARRLLKAATEPKPLEIRTEILPPKEGGLPKQLVSLLQRVLAKTAAMERNELEEEAQVAIIKLQVAARQTIRALEPGRPIPAERPANGRRRKRRT
jgi:hypothetical protein